ncbi:MAG TPA: twin-arginine translocation signal domain-containing protein, partial [Casimicrobiaceae bacterium]
MDDDKQDSEKLHKDGADLSRRDFLALSVAAGLAAAAGSTLAGAQQVVETDVTIKTPDGTCDAAF